MTVQRIRQCEESFVMGGKTVQCTYPLGHTVSECSFARLRQQYLADVRGGSGLPDDVETLITNLRNGNADRYIEVLLSALHDRKRAIRGVPGFPRER